MLSSRMEAMMPPWRVCGYPFRSAPRERRVVQVGIGGGVEVLESLEQLEPDEVGVGAVGKGGEVEVELGLGLEVELGSDDGYWDGDGDADRGRG